MNCSLTILLASFLVAAVGSRVASGEETRPVKFSGGHEICKNDFGRPVPLMAAALGVQPDVFREAFRGVTPARGREPSGDEQRANKEALMRVLAPHGVTNARMDEVADYYRFRPERGELWPTKPAKAHAVIDDGKVKLIVVEEAGSGYSSPPTAVVAGFDSVRLGVTLGLGKDLKKNGGVKAVEIR